MKYWHELTDEEVDAIYAAAPLIKDVVDNYKQPDWCTYPGALAGIWGCWSLISRDTREQISHEFCKTCDLYKNHKP